MIWISGLWALPFWFIGIYFLSESKWAITLLTIILLLIAPIPAVIRKKRSELLLKKKLEENEMELHRVGSLYKTMEYRFQRLKEDLSDATSQARIAHQLTMLGQFVLGFLHEVNNPLAILAGRVEVLLEERKNDKNLCRDIEQIQREANYIEKIAGTLLPAFRKARVEKAFEPASPKISFTNILESFKDIIKNEQIEIVPELSETSRVNVPSHVVEEIIRILITNSIQALKESDERKIWIKLKQDNPAKSSVLIEIEDNGIGVPEEIRKHLFEPFVTLRKEGKGSGLGLFLALCLLEIYDGTISYEQRLGGGARFIVELPKALFTREQPYHWFVSAIKESKE